MRYRLAGAFTLCAILSLGAWFWYAQTRTFTLTILHFNDLHSHLDPSAPDGTPCVETCIGGIARMRTEIDAVRARSPHTLVLASGDNFQGSLYFSLFGGAFLAEALNALGVDASGLGNHEFDRGADELAAFADAAQFPLIASNVVSASSSPLAGKILPVTVIHKGGRAIGVIGAVTAETPALSSPEAATHFLDEAAALRAAVAQLHQEGVGIIIALTHVGYDADLRLAEEVPGIDVIVGGHSDTLLSNTQEGAEGPYPTRVQQADGHPVLIVQTVPYGTQLGELAVTFDRRGEIVSSAGEPRILEDTIPQDAEVAALLESRRGALEEAGNTHFGMLPDDLAGEPEHCRRETCALGATLADLMRDAHPAAGTPQIALLNSGSIRGSLRSGAVSAGDIASALPFDDGLVYGTTTGAALLSALEESFGRRTERSGGFLQFSGIVVRTAPEDPSEICAVAESKDGSPIDPSATYGIVTTAYLASGGDGYEFMGDPTPLGTSTNALLERALRNNQYLSAPQDARIVAQCN
jgi:5'-nucleotidase